MEEYPSKPLASFFMFGISHGFRIGFNQPSSTLKSAKKNLDCALQHPQVVEEYLLEEVTQQRVAGPFHASAVPKIHISRFSVIPKNHKPNKWRLTVDLSYPTGHSMNDRISTHLRTLTYITVDTAIEHILTLGAGTQLANNEKELVPIILSCAVWGLLLTKKTTVFQCDNRSVVDVMNKGSSKDAMVMHLLRCVWFLYCNF